MLMGGGGSFSAGGPGKGMHSRLCKFFPISCVKPTLVNFYLLTYIAPSEMSFPYDYL